MPPGLIGSRSNELPQHQPAEAGPDQVGDVGASSPGNQPGSEGVETVVPLLQERGSLRADYTGVTLRDNLGLT